MNENWPRWIKASINKFFSDRKTTLNFYYEGQERNTSGLPNWCELRLNGPFSEECSRNYWKIHIDVNILIANILDRNDLYKLDRLIGKVTNIYEVCIPIYKKGFDPEIDTNALLETMQRVSSIETDNYGIVDPETRLEHSIVQARYKMVLMT